MLPTCPCGEPLPDKEKHRNEHPGECCDCYDVGWDFPIDKINIERAKRGAPLLIERHKSKQ